MKLIALGLALLWLTLANDTAIADVITGLTDVQQAKRLYNAICKRDPKDLSSLSKLAKIRFRFGEHELAFETLQKTERLQKVSAKNDDPNPKRTVVPAELNMAAFFQSDGEHRKTELWFEKAIVVDRTFQSTGEFAYWLVNQNRPKEAMKWIRLAERNGIEIVDESDQYFQTTESRDLLMALSHRMLGSFNDAEHLLSKLHRDKPENGLVSNQLALVLIESTDEGKRGRALQIAVQNVEQSETAETLTTLGWIRYRLGAVRDAERILKNAITNRPSIPRDAFLYLAEVERRLGNPNEAATFKSIAEKAAGPIYFTRPLETSE